MANYKGADLVVRKKLAMDENTPANVLQQLSEDSEVEIRYLVASNPNTSEEVLLQLGKEFPEAITANPVFKLLASENPESRFIKLSLARSSTTSEETLARLLETEEEDEYLCIALASNINSHINLLEELAVWKTSRHDMDINDFVYRNEYSGKNVHVAVATNPKTPSSLLEKLASNISCIVRASVTKNSNVTPEILDKLARNKALNVLLAVAKNCQTSASTLEYLAANSDNNVRMAVLQHANVSDIAKEIAEFMAATAITPVHVKEKVVNDSDLDFIV